MFTIKDWKNGIKILDLNPQMPICDLAKELGCQYSDANELISNYCKIFKVKRPKIKRGVLVGIDFQMNKIYGSKLK